MAGLLICALGCAVGGYFIGTSPEIQKFVRELVPGQKPTQVRIGTVAPGELTRTVAAPGQIEPKTSVKISAQVSARIIALPFRENDVVKKGDVIVRLDARDLAALLDASRANLRGEQSRLEGAQAALTRARQDRDRVKKLAQSGDVAQSALEQAESAYLQAVSNVRTSESAIEAARAQIIRSEKDLENTTIVSPIDGTITRLDAEVGELVVVGTLNSAGSVIMEIADLSSMVLKARVDESNIVPVKPGQVAKIFINAFGDRAFKGSVERVELQRKVDRDNTGYFEVWIPVDLEKGQTLQSGLTANCEIGVEIFSNVLVVPSQAVVDRKVDELPAGMGQNPLIAQGSAYARVVFTLVRDESEAPKDAGKQGKADSEPRYKVAIVPVKTGSSDLTRTVILAGLKGGEKIVVGPFKVLQGLKNDQVVVEESRVKNSGSKPSQSESPSEPDQPGQPESGPAEHEAGTR